MDNCESNEISQKEINKNNKVSQAMNISLSLNVDQTENPLTLTPDYSKLPELNSDKDIEEVLCKISELLTSNSVSSAPDIDDSRTIEEILKEAEDIVKDSSSYFDEDEHLKSSHIDGCNLDALSDRTECSIELDPELQSKHLSLSSQNSANQDQGANLPLESKTDNLLIVPNLSREINVSQEVNNTRENNQVQPDPVSLETNINSAINTSQEISLKNGSFDSIQQTNVKNTLKRINDKPLTLKDLEVPDRPTNLDLNVIRIEPYRPDSINTSISQPHKPQLTFIENSNDECLIRNNESLNNSILTNNIESRISSSEVHREDSVRNVQNISREDNLVQIGILSSAVVKMRQPIPSVHKERPKSAPFVSDITVENIKKVYEEKIFNLESQIRILTIKLSELEKSEEKSSRKEDAVELTRLSLLEKEVQNQEQLIAAYQRENQKLLADTNKAKKVWIEAEKRLGEKVLKLERELKRANQLNTTEAFELKEALADARDELTRLEESSIQLRNEKRELEKKSTELVEEVKRLKNESEKYRNDLELMRAREKERERRVTAEHSLATATLQGKLSQANSELSRKQTEVVRLNTEVTRLRGDLERARLGSVVTGDASHSHSTSHQVRQLEIALERERENSRRTLVQLETLNKHNLDLSRQVKELESIVKRRSKSGGGIPWGDDTSNDVQRIKESFENKTKKLEHELSLKEKQLSENQAKLNDLQNKYDKEVSNLQEKIRRTSSSTSVRSQNSRHPPSNDTQLIATIRGLKAEITSKDKQLNKLTRELDETKRKMTRSQSQQSNIRQPLNNNRNHSNTSSKVSESGSTGATSSSGNNSKNYNPFLFEEDRETILFLRNENANLHEEVKRLEQDLINLHNKRLQDLSELESNHSAEVKRAIREQTARQTNSQITHMRGQIYTQQMVINHLKNQIKVMEQKSQDIEILKAERDQLEGSLMEANKKVATLHQLSSPDSSDYHDLLEKLDWLEKRHELREAKLQTIVKELVARQQTSNVCNSSSCKDKLYNKNREICYYRAEIDKILDSLTEFKYIK